MKSLALLAILASTALADERPPEREDRPKFDHDQVYRVPQGTGPTEGPASAPVTIVVWSDFGCGYCARVQSTLDQLRRLYPGQLRFVHRTLPLDEDNLIGSEAALAAAAQGRFVPMKDRLYALAGRVDRPAVELIARELGLDLIRFRADLDTGTWRKQIGADVQDAMHLGITGTPSFFINGRPLDGSQPLRAFTEVVEQELSRAGASATSADYDRLVANGLPMADSDDKAPPLAKLDPMQPYRIGLGLPGHQLGPDDAPVTIVEFSDFQCPYCARTAPIMARARAKYGDQLRIIFRHYPVSGHRNAGLAAEAAVAASVQGKFWAFQDQIWAHFGALERSDLETYATAAGLDMTQFRAALETRKYRDVVVAEQSAGAAAGIDGTPTMFINGFPVIGSKREDALFAIIDGRLDQARRAVAAGLPVADVYPLVMTAAKGVELADPSTIPAPSSVKLEMRPDERVRGITAACRRGDAARARLLAGGLAGDSRRRAADVCAISAIDL